MGDERQCEVIYPVGWRTRAVVPRHWAMAWADAQRLNCAAEGPPRMESSMRSKGGKIEYLCPECGSPSIQIVRVIGAQKSGACNVCNSWWAWRSRVKRKALNDAPANSMPTMDSLYGDNSDHEACPKCGLCIPCGDCSSIYGCGEKEVT